LPLQVVEDPRQWAGINQIGTLQITGRASPSDVLPYLDKKLRLRRFGFSHLRIAHGLRDLLDAPQLAELEFLLLGENHELESIAGINRWADTMTGIYLRTQRLMDVWLLADLPNLTFANLRDISIDSLEFVRELRVLERLHIGGAGAEIPDLSPLCALPVLNDLHVWGDSLVDLSGLAHATDLTVHIQHGRQRPLRGKEMLPPSVVVKYRGVPVAR
jgi:hypothetical protein